MHTYIHTYIYIHIEYDHSYSSSASGLFATRHSKELKDPTHERTEIKLDPEEEDLLLDTIVYAESMNIWAAELGWSGWYGKI
jgi:hypothetical protein